ncbi:hypothetical protein OIY81_1556 [Cryptosporidium canis]|nr:hypothetical protein OIY81_1556 [Cryptosporidium canis]
MFCWQNTDNTEPIGILHGSELVWEGGRRDEEDDGCQQDNRPQNLGVNSIGVVDEEEGVHQVSNNHKLTSSPYSIAMDERRYSERDDRNAQNKVSRIPCTSPFAAYAMGMAKVPIPSIVLTIADTASLREDPWIAPPSPGRVSGSPSNRP